MRYLIFLFCLFFLNIGHCYIDDNGIEVLRKSGELVNSNTSYEYQLRVHDLANEVIALYQGQLDSLTYDTIVKEEEGTNGNFKLLFQSNDDTAFTLEVVINSSGTGYTVYSSTGFLKLESGDYLLQESGDKILL